MEGGQAGLLVPDPRLPGGVDDRGRVADGPHDAVLPVMPAERVAMKAEAGRETRFWVNQGDRHMAEWVFEQWCARLWPTWPLFAGSD